MNNKEIASSFVEEIEIACRHGKQPLGIYSDAWCDIAKVLYHRHRKRVESGNLSELDILEEKILKERELKQNEIH